MNETCEKCKYGIIEERKSTKAIICSRYPQMTKEIIRYTADHYCGEWKSKGETKMNEEKGDELSTIAMVNNYAILELSDRVEKLETEIKELIEERLKHSNDNK